MLTALLLAATACVAQDGCTCQRPEAPSVGCDERHLTKALKIAWRYAPSSADVSTFDGTTTATITTATGLTWTAVGLPSVAQNLRDEAARVLQRAERGLSDAEVKATKLRAEADDLEYVEAVMKACGIALGN